MTDTPNSILREANDRMHKAVDHLKNELRGLRTGRASTGLVEHVKVDYYGTATDLKALAALSLPEPTQILIKPFDAAALHEIKKAIETSDLGLNPMVDGKQLRVNLPALSTDRRKQLVAHAKKVGEETKVSLRNVRRDANKHADALKNNKAAHFPEDQLEDLKEKIQDALKKFEGEADKLVGDKSKEIMEI